MTNLHYDSNEIQAMLQKVIFFRQFNHYLISLFLKETVCSIHYFYSVWLIIYGKIRFKIIYTLIEAFD